MNEPIGLTILGSTGSVGASTLDVIGRHDSRFRVIALTANRHDEALFAQCLSHNPLYAVMADAVAADRLRDRLQAVGRPVEVLAGLAGLERVASLPETDYVMAAIVGAAGLLPTLAAARARKRVLLANKEALVMAGPLFMAAVREHGAELLPIDSEHNAIFQCLPSGFATDGLGKAGIRRILLTGSGGPFRLTAPERLADVTPEQACAHPNWSMGRKISVDSATMMNKGLEVIEAHWLFGAAPEQIEVVIHPQSIIHSMVEYEDGSVLAQLGNPDMRTPIAHALAWPRRLASGVAFLDFARLGRLDFQAPDFTRFPCLRLAFAALAVGGTAPTILNAANEVAVQAFLEGKLRFTEIAVAVEQVLARVTGHAADTLQQILADDALARSMACEWIAARARGA
ncbi:MAG: 1-deoxy-D-xylulose-5-phosphate reductoisomerase [Candidatus Competibacter denitrificans]